VLCDVFEPDSLRKSNSNRILDSLLDSDCSSAEFNFLSAERTGVLLGLGELSRALAKINDDPVLQSGGAEEQGLHDDLLISYAKQV
jgi:hypothetical protein